MVFPSRRNFATIPRCGEAIPRCGEILLGFRYNAFFETYYLVVYIIL